MNSNHKNKSLTLYMKIKFKVLCNQTIIRKCRIILKKVLKFFLKIQILPSEFKTKI